MFPSAMKLYEEFLYVSLICKLAYLLNYNTAISFARNDATKADCCIEALR
jgi:hypothetical protein